MENGLEVASKNFDDIEEIHSLEFIDNDEKLLIMGGKRDSNQVMLIIWDLYNTGEVVEVKEYSPITKDRLDRLARTSGNILHVDDEGEVTSVLRNKLKQDHSENWELNNKT